MTTPNVLSILVQQGLLNETHLRGLAGSPAEAAIATLVTAGAVTPDDLLRVLSEHYRVPGVMLRDHPVAPEVLALVSAEVAGNLQVLPLTLDGDVLVVAMADPGDLVAEDLIRFMTGRSTRRVVALPQDLRQTIARLYRGDGAAGPPGDDSPEGLQALEFSILEEKDGFDEDVAESLAEESSKTPVIRAVNEIITTAVRLRASDIHLEPTEQDFRVRFRIDGVLREIFHLPRRVQATIISRCKIIAGMDISEKRRPQDGRINVRSSSVNVDLRVSTLPTFLGEKMVMRLLERDRARVDVSRIGMSERDARTFHELITLPQGMLIITGPTGSGKTSTLYGALHQVATVDVNVVTVEDPVEYTLPGINQVQVNEKAGLTFASALRSILRQDPNVVMLGEIRDEETAEIAFQAAMTGHLVLSTLHTNDAPSAIPRLVYMGLPRYLVAGSLEGILAQRLVRRICPHCRVPATPDEAQVRMIRASDATTIPDTFFRGEGCKECDGTGYSGRLGIFELLRVTDPVRTLIYQEASEQDLRLKAREQGMHTLLEDGLIKVGRGETTLEELLRIAPVTLKG